MAHGLPLMIFGMGMSRSRKRRKSIQFLLCASNAKADMTLKTRINMLSIIRLRPDCLL